MTATVGFNMTGGMIQHKLGTQQRAERGRVNTSSFWPRYDKDCCSRRVVTLSGVAASTAGVPVESHNTMSRTTTLGRQYSLTKTLTREKFVQCTKLCTMYKGCIVGGTQR